ncbi:MAG: peptide ABC transporter substrate-binding protein [Clostridium sulfidigenes]|uniref:Peptide ABC transporter substrate-binding protein n=1 Tax=Clostridium sulfidigenes TaxID=318464 RepID=A0A927W5S5_9CLOT|nr:peptide ABC transporter substrate-binding protein [Clostridium sulfidigenes]
MKSKKILASLLALSMITSVALVGCGKGEEKGAGTATNGEADAEQYLNMLLQSEPKTIDQSKSSDSYSSQILANCQESLTRIVQDENGKDKIEKGIAESWETSDDKLTWTFKLRDAKWSDGKPVTAEQFVYGITRTLDQNTASPYAFLLYPIANAVEFNSGKAKAEDLGVKAIDEKTVEFTLASPCAYFLDLTYFKVMQPQREDIVKEHGDKYGSEANSMVYCGPFMISEWVHNNKVEFVKNPEYWDAENVKLDKVTMKIIKEESARMNELLNGSLDMATVVKPEWIEKFDSTGEYESKKGYDGSTTYTFFNLKDKLFSNAKVRKAFIVAEDRENKIKTLRKGLGEPALGFVPKSVQIGGEEYRTKVNELPVQKLMDENTDPKALLIEGMKELGLGEDPSKITISYLQSGTDAVAKEYAEFQQQVYTQKLGINVKVDFVEWAQFQERTDNFDYQVAGMAWTGDYNDPNTYLDLWTSTAGVVPTGWSNPKYDELIAKAGKSDDPNERAELFKEAERILLYEDGVVSPEAWRFKNTYVRKYVKNYTAPLFGTIDLKYTYTTGRK